MNTKSPIEASSVRHHLHWSYLVEHKAEVVITKPHEAWYPIRRQVFAYKYFPDVSGEIIILFHFSSKNIVEGSCFLLNLHHAALQGYFRSDLHGFKTIS